MYALDEFAGDKDLSKTRTFTLENGNKLYAKQSDPYGFWALNLDKGQLPEAFRGQYSTWDHVLREVERYKTLRDIAVVSVQDKKK